MGSAAGGFLLGRPNRGLLVALGRFGRILKLGCRRFVGLLLRGGGTLLRSLRCGALPLFGSRPRFQYFTLCHCARVFLVLDRLVALGFPGTPWPLRSSVTPSWSSSTAFSNSSSRLGWGSTMQYGYPAIDAR